MARKAEAVVVAENAAERVRRAAAVPLMLGVMALLATIYGHTASPHRAAPDDPVPAPVSSRAIDDDPPEEEPEYIEVTYWEAVRDDAAGASFEGVATHLGRASGVTVEGSVSCPQDESPPTRQVIGGTITSQWGEEIHYTVGTCSGDPDVRVVTGGSGRFEGATGAISTAASTLPEFSSFATGRLRVRADLWEDWLPSAPRSAPPSPAGLVELAYFEGLVAVETSAPESGCDHSLTPLVVCDFHETGELRGPTIGEATYAATGHRAIGTSMSCDNDDGSTSRPELRLATGTITVEGGDQLFYSSLARLGGCADHGSGLETTVTYRLITGGTGRFERAHGLISGVEVPELGFAAIGLGRLFVHDAGEGRNAGAASSTRESTHTGAAE
ncbi:MAG: hypothetical protein R8F63_13545 [Acidimicrobiales bacterium]|nr:hypothetical protein [Acidimicrobiales bacterium]